MQRGELGDRGRLRVVLRWFGHTADCRRGHEVPKYRGPDALVCDACMPEHVPTCPMCGAPAPLRGVRDGYRHHTFWSLCPACVAKVQAAGPWRLRRARAIEARIGALQQRFPQLYAVEMARQRVVLGGDVDGRPVRVTLRIAAREGEDERYVLRAAIAGVQPEVGREALRLAPELIEQLSRRSPSVTKDAHRWLRIAFLHLGKLDIVRALEGLIETAARIDDPAPP
jgi:hypothetical protein